MRIRYVLLLLLAPLLAACEQDSAAYMVEDNSDHALTLVRDVKYWWSDKAELSMVVARFPDCQRRHAMKAQSASSSKVMLYALGERRFAVQQGKNWYFVDMQTCTLQSAEAPKEGESGTLVGNWQKKDGKLVFLPVKAEAGSAPAAKSAE
ncbi:MAG TPA: hypothetical protein PLX20_13650 [Rhodocyclaceae bacterium]|nr:hypothetical protein [Rhodocyclaceae bacterium]HMV52486.1 hypothetical protein [Rhodocyclaceae bacterium]HMZ84644.1 hypothetical protein [Rhodocyclaceae bacterium]HNA03268.1 hypothetical protein [Rhodocyclaceae bacterium]HNB78735.1 hypothetical protein [Rhodocyclaceae bacterium]